MAASALDLQQIMRMIRDPASGMAILQPPAPAMPEYTGPPLAPGSTSADVMGGAAPQAPIQAMAGPMDFGPPDTSGLPPQPSPGFPGPNGELASPETAGLPLTGLQPPPPDTGGLQLATSDVVPALQAGAQAPTKLSRLLHFMATIGKGAGQGVADALASGALNAAPGKSSFGAGFQGAQMMPFMRQQRAAQLAQAAARARLEAAQTKQAEAQAETLPIWRKALAKRLEAQATPKPTYHATPKGLMQVDAQGNPVGIVKGTEATPQPEQQAMADLIDGGLTAAEAYEEIQKQKRAPTAFSAWRAQNPNAPVEDFIKLGPEARAQFVTPTYQPAVNAAGEITGRFNTRTGTVEPVENPTGARKTGAPASKGATPQQFAQIEAKKAAALAAAQKSYARGDFDEQQLEDAKQEAQNAYEAEIKALGGNAQHYEYPAAPAGGGPAQAKAPAKAGGKKAVGPTVAEIDAAKPAVPQGRVLVWKAGKFQHVPQAQAQAARDQGFSVFE